MATEVWPIARFSNMLIHYYFVPPYPTFGPGAAAAVPRQTLGRTCPARLRQRWSRQPDGSLAAVWQTV
jgi:hypothetical protein